jgi:formaldehyde-activating enzyme involved in methanogenesis
MSASILRACSKWYGAPGRDYHGEAARIGRERSHPHNPRRQERKGRDAGQCGQAAARAAARGGRGEPQVARPAADIGSVTLVTTESRITQQDIERLVAGPQESGVAQAMATFEIVEKAYFKAVAAAPQVIVTTSYATTTAPR